jgi:predicted dienelactone hydrolase
MNLRYLYCCISVFFILSLGWSCSTEISEIHEEPENPYLYQSKTSFQPIKLDRIQFRPNHRNGPNVLPFYSYSDLHLSIWVPDNAASPLPVVIYSHGGGSRTNPGESGVEWGKSLSTAGYAVIAMHHMIRSTEDVVINICGELDVLENDCDLSIYTPYYESTDRAKDAIAVMNNLETIGNTVGYTFDSDNIAIMGFSGGTNATHYLSGGKRNAIFGVSNEVAYFSVQEPRPKAFLAMSPGSGTQGGWTSESLATINRPFLCATGLADLSSTYRAEFYDQLNGNDQYRLYINSSSSDHATFNLALAGNDEDKMNQEIYHTWLESIGVAFLDAYIFQNQEAKKWLRSGSLPSVIHEILSESDDIPTWSYR